METMLFWTVGLQFSLRRSQLKGFPGGSAVKNHLPSRRHGFDPWIRKIIWRRKWEPSILAWEISGTEEPGMLQSRGSQKSQM